MSSLAFFRPAYLWGLLLVIVPLVLHFVNRRRTVTLRFSTNRFFLPTDLRADRLRSLKRLLQLLARIVMLAMIVLLFARPYRADDPFSILKNPQTPVYVWQDPSVSMTYRYHGVSLAQQSQGFLDSLVAFRGSRGNVFYYRRREQRFVPVDALPAAAVPTVFGPDQTSRVMSIFDEQRLESKLPGVLVLVSDFQEPVVNALDSLVNGSSMPLPVLCVTMGPVERPDAAVRCTGIAAAGVSGIRGVVVAQGMDFSGQVKAESDGATAGQRAVQVAAGDSCEVVVEVPEEFMTHGGMLVLEGPDPYAANNSAPFSPRSTMRGSILVVGNQPAVYPVVAALTIARRGKGQVFTAEPSLVTYDDIERADLILLEQLSVLPPPLASLIASRALGRKAVLISPLLTEAGRMVAAETQTGNAPTIAQSRNPLPIVLSDTVSMVWRGFPRTVESLVHVQRYLAGFRGTTLARLGNGVPFATVRRDTTGIVWMNVAAPLGIADGNNLCETGFYVPFLDRLCSYGLSMILGDERTWLAGFPRRNPFYGSRIVARVYDDADKLVSQWGSQPLVALEQPGLYRVQPEGRPVEWIPVVADPSEAAIRAPFPAIPAPWKQFVAVVDGPGLAAFLEKYQRMGLTQLIWIIVIASLLLEVFAGNGKSRKPGALSHRPPTQT